MASTAELRRIVLHLRKFLKDRLREALDAHPNDWGDLVHKPLDEIIDEHLVPEHDLLTVTRADILSRLLRSAQNRQSASKVISGSIVEGRDLDEKWATLGKWLYGFNPEAILAHWADDEGVGCKDIPNANGLIRS